MLLNRIELLEWSCVKAEVENSHIWCGANNCLDRARNAFVVDVLMVDCDQNIVVPARSSRSCRRIIAKVGVTEDNSGRHERTVVPDWRSVRIRRNECSSAICRKNGVIGGYAGVENGDSRER